MAERKQEGQQNKQTHTKESTTPTAESVQSQTGFSALRKLEKYPAWPRHYLLWL